MPYTVGNRWESKKKPRNHCIATASGNGADDGTRTRWFVGYTPLNHAVFYFCVQTPCANLMD